MITKDQIEAAARSYAYNTRYDTFSMESGDVDNDAFKAGALWMQEQMEAQKRFAWIAARYQTMNERGEFNWRFERFEDWNVRAADNKTEKPTAVQYEIDRLEARKVIYK